MPMKNPPHPGDFIRTEIIDPVGLSVTAAATDFMCLPFERDSRMSRVVNAPFLMR